MQQPSSLDLTSRSASDQSASTSSIPNVDYLQQALDTLVVPASPAENELVGPLQCLQGPFPRQQTDLSLHMSTDDLHPSLAAPLRVLDSEVVGAHPLDASARKPNREYQRRFRLRSKVCN